MATLRRVAPLLLVVVFAQLPLALALARGWSSGGEIHFDAATAPRELADYRAVADTPLEPEVLDMLRPASYVMRLYRSERGGPDTWLYLASYSAASDTTGAHDPTVCYPAQGWDLQDVHTLRVPLANGESFPARLLVANQAGQEELALYWFQPMDRWPQRAPWEQLLRAYDGFAGRPQYVFVRLSTESSASAETELVEIARHLAPWLRSAMRNPPLAAASAGE